MWLIYKVKNQRKEKFEMAKTKIEYSGKKFWDDFNQFRKLKINEKAIIPKGMINRARNFTCCKKKTNLILDMQTAIYLPCAAHGSHIIIADIKNLTALTECLTSQENRMMQKAKFCYHIIGGQALCWVQVILEDEKTSVLFENCCNHFMIDHGSYKINRIEEEDTMFSAVDPFDLGQLGGRNSFSENIALVVNEGWNNGGSGAGGSGVGGSDSETASNSYLNCVNEKLDSRIGWFLGAAAIVCLASLAASSSAANPEIGVIICGVAFTVAIAAAVASSAAECL